MKPKLFLLIFIALMIISCIVTLIQVNKTIDASVKARCLTYNLQGWIDMTDLQQLCSNEDCTYYFHLRIKYFEDAINECGAGEIFIDQKEATKEDIYINIDDLNKSGPDVYVKDNQGNFIKDGN